MLKRITFIGIVLFFFTITLYLCFFRLGAVPLENWDEAWYADMMRNVLRSGNLAVMYWNKFPLLDKPPLYIWLGSLTSLVFGLNEFAVRLPSAIAGFLMIGVVTWYATRRWGLLAGIVAWGTLALNNVFMWRVRTGNLDALVTLLVLLVFLTVLSRFKHKYIMLGSLFAGIFLAKASLVVFPFGLFVLSELIYERRNMFHNPAKYIPVILIPIVLCGIWLLAGSQQVGQRFALYYLFHSDQNVARITVENFKTDYIMYAYYALQRRFFFAFLLGSFLILFRLRHKDSFLLFFFSWSLLFLLSFTERKNNWYLVPAMPYWSLIAGFGISQVIRFFHAYPRVQFVLIVGVLCVGGYIFFKTFTVNIQALIYTSGPKDQAEAVSYIAKHAKEKDIVIRTDQLYPVTIFYSGIKTYAFDASAGLSDIGIGEQDLGYFLEQKKIQWISGTISDLDMFRSKYMKSINTKIVFQNSTEAVCHVVYK